MQGGQETTHDNQRYSGRQQQSEQGNVEKTKHFYDFDIDLNVITPWDKFDLGNVLIFVFRLLPIWYTRKQLWLIWWKWQLWWWWELLLANKQWLLICICIASIVICDIMLKQIVYWQLLFFYFFLDIGQNLGHRLLIFGIMTNGKKNFFLLIFSFLCV